jgi:neutral ceramidase
MPFPRLRSLAPWRVAWRVMPGISLVIGTCSLNLPACAAELRAGAAEVIITPPSGIGLAGYYFERGADGTNDDLFAKALVLDADGTKVALVTVDLISTTRQVVEAARRTIEQETGIPGTNVMVSATHAHTGPVLSNRGAREDWQGGATEMTANYSAALPTLIAASVRLAARRLEPARVAAAVVQEPGLSFNRRFHMRDGSVGWNPGKLNTNIVRPAGPIDPEVGVLFVDAPRGRQPGKPIATYVNFAMHPDTVGGSKFSADYPAALARRLAEYKGPDMVTLFANGACGNINHVNVHWAETQKGPEEAARLGTVLAGDVFKAWMQLRSIPPAALRVSSETVKLPLPALKPGEVERARETVVRFGMKDNRGFMEKVEAYKILDVAAREGKPHEVEVQVIALGTEAAWVSLPGEIFVELGLAIKKASPFRHTFIAELANGSIGYIPNRSAYAEGNYEPISARCAPGSGELLVENAIQQLRVLHAAARAKLSPNTD